MLFFINQVYDSIEREYKLGISYINVYICLDNMVKSDGC